VSVDGAMVPLVQGEWAEVKTLYQLRLISSGKIGERAGLAGSHRTAPGEEPCPAASSWSLISP
jgi:hypothetical protein